ncbi:MAG: NAD(P)-dependent alcohol dehydrogenase [Rhodobacteraceae bacterium]|nr:NAD(P)-dependent alcohol dehydrogenase [Paracoccaceae bacterium]
MENTLNAWDVSHYGGPDVLVPVTRPISRPKAGQVLIRIRASAVSRADGMMRAGQPKFARLFLGLCRPRASLSGTCFSGDIVAVDEGVADFKVGDAVLGEAGMQFGANATHLCMDAQGSLVVKPNAVSYEEGATLCDGAMTSWHFLTRVTQVRPGEKILILGGAGSLGTAAVQFASALGAEVSATASARNHDLLRNLGADHAIDYRATDPLKRGMNYDIIFDTLGVATYGAAKPALAKGGRYLCPVLGLRLFRDMLLSSVFGGKRAKFAAAGMAPPAVHREELSEVIALMGEQKFAPVMDRTYPFSDLVEAHRYVEAGHKRGNVVIV